jgi:hypothetical protein
MHEGAAGDGILVSASAKGRESCLEIAKTIHGDADLNKAKLDLFDEIQTRANRT